MAKIVFWSPFKEAVGCTHVAVAVSSLMGITHKSTCLLMHSNFGTKKIEACYTLYNDLKNGDMISESSLGISSVARLLKSNKLTPDAIQNYAKPVLKGRLDVLYGTESDSSENKDILKDLPFIIKKANDIYDAVFIDLTKTTDEEYVKEILADADLVITVVNQDYIKIDEYFEKYINIDILKNKTKLLVIGDYESKSKYNTSNLKFKYRYKDTIFAVPHNYIFADACNDGNVLDFLYKNINADSKDYNGFFITQTSNIVEKIVEITKIKE
ncbi:MAG: hypothetical protein Q4D02_00145 [Clostridia bacterium]|nr:hypothetical protein [Clostridia bacterium]